MKKIGLILVGGGGKGAYHIGVWKALREAGLDKYVSSVSGTSVGGLNAALFMQGNLERAEEIWENISREKILTPRSVFNRDDQKQVSLYCRSGLSEIIDKYLDMNIFDESDKNCYITCVKTRSQKARDSYVKMYTSANGTKDCQMYVNGKATYFNIRRFSKEERKSILLATSAMPFIFPKEKIGNYYYLDGGLIDNKPVEPLYRIEGCEIIVVVHLSTNSGHIDHNNFPNARIWEIRPGQDQGDFLDGTLDFDAENAKRRMRQGYDDSKEMFKEIAEICHMENESLNHWEDFAKKEIRERQLMQIKHEELMKGLENGRALPMMKCEENSSLKTDAFASGFNEKIDAFTKDWNSEEMVELLVESEFVLSLNDGQIAQLDESGLKRFWSVIKGIQGKNEQIALGNIQEIQKITAEIQKILLKRNNCMFGVLEILNEKVNTQIYWTQDIVSRLCQKLNLQDRRLQDVEVEVKLLKWKESLLYRTMPNGKKYIEVSDGMKILLVVSDLFKITYANNHLIERDYLEAVLQKELGLHRQIYCSDFYRDIIYEKENLSLYVKAFYDYHAGNISNYGQRIYKIQEFYADPLIDEICKCINMKPEELCRKLISNQLSEEEDEIVETADLCQRLIRDMVCLEFDYQIKMKNQAALEAKIMQEISEKEDNTQEEEPILAEEKERNKKADYSVFRLTPEGLRMFREVKERDDYRGLEPGKDYVFSNEISIRDLLDLNPYMVTAPLGYFYTCESDVHSIFKMNKVKYISLADYYMYLWFRHKNANEKKDRKVVFLECYDKNLYASGYTVNLSGDGYQKEFSSLKIPYTKGGGDIIREIMSQKIFTGLHEEDVLFFKTFYADAHIDRKLREKNVEMIDEAWENIFNTDSNNRREIVQDIIDKLTIIKN